jgi:hypothetical protein
LVAGSVKGKVKKYKGLFDLKENNASTQAVDGEGRLVPPAVSRAKPPHPVVAPGAAAKDTERTFSAF